jgi:site-specific recombinase XerD
MIKVSACLFKSKTLKDNSHPVLIRFSQLKLKKYISTGLSSTVDEWDFDLNRYKLNKPEKKKLHLKNNLLIDKIIFEAQSLIVDNFDFQKVYSIESIIEKLIKKNKPVSVFTFIESFIARLEKAGKNGNALAYKNTFGVFKTYRNEKDLSFDELTYKVLINFEEDLQGRGRKINAISFHMRTLRSLYNKAIKEGIAQQELYPFKDYCVKREKTSKRAIVKGNISAIKELDLSDELDLDKARDYFLFSFYTRGMAFVDLAFLKVSNIYGDRLTYSRNKTNQKFSIKLTSQISEIISKYNDLSIKDSYLFPIIIDPKGDIYTQYRNGMRLTNKKLNKIGELIGLNVPLTTYVSRHSWATIAKREGVPTAVISEGLGHETERTTQIYLDSFENQVLDDANDLITNI